MIEGNPEEENWNTWNLDKVAMSGDSYYKRAVGELPEKEASKSYVNFMKKHNLYEKGNTLLDYGCAAGHFYRSFKNRLDKNAVYTGIDTHLPFLFWGKEVFGVNNRCNFIHCDALDLPLLDNSYDISIINLFHFFPKIDDALKEAMRVTKKYVIWRTPVGEKSNYAIKIFMDENMKQLGVLTPDKNDIDYDIYMIFTEKYIRQLVNFIKGKVTIVERDTDFGEFDNAVMPEFAHIPATKTVNGLQVNGNLILDWHYVVIDCEE
jgi:ubiquinone/menaquinone biosynthesis C-methylase UbiE